jgi:hypothetical protein
MELLAHRGVWHERAERNTLPALVAAFEHGWGVETDVRDLGGRVVISHDCPAADHDLDLAHVLVAWREHGRRGRLALNVKADGLQGMVMALLHPDELAEVFVFDASVPDERMWLQTHVPTYVRHSELEPSPQASPHYARAQGVWLDAFVDEWWSADTVREHLDRGLGVTVVSPELHGRSHRTAWDLLIAAGLWHRPGLALCTDLPCEAAAIG